MYSYIDVHHLSRILHLKIVSRIVVAVAGTPGSARPIEQFLAFVLFRLLPSSPHLHPDTDDTDENGTHGSDDADLGASTETRAARLRGATDTSTCLTWSICCGLLACCGRLCRAC